MFAKALAKLAAACSFGLLRHKKNKGRQPHILAPKPPEVDFESAGHLGKPKTIKQDRFKTWARCVTQAAVYKQNLIDNGVGNHKKNPNLQSNLLARDWAEDNL